MRILSTAVGYRLHAFPMTTSRKNTFFLWRMFLDEVLPDKNMQKVLQEFLGSIFVDRRVAKMETMLVLRGSGSNGKSVVF